MNNRPDHPGRLAIFGAPPFVTEKYKESWRQISYRAAWKLFRAALQDQIIPPGGGDPVGPFEQQFSKVAGTKYSILMNSGTAALHSAYFAAGVKPGDEVIVPAYTFHASATPILQCGGVPVFCDVDPDTLTIDPEDAEARITDRTKVICAVHIWGNPARMDALRDVCARHKIVLIEDCSHAHGAIYQGRPVGSWGDIGCFSLQGSKPVSGGELGVATTSNPTLHDHMLCLGHFGRAMKGQKADTYDIGYLSMGLKYRPHYYAAMLALDSLSRLPELNECRNRNYEILSEELSDCPAIRPIATYPDAKRGGLLEFIFEYFPEHAGNWSREAFVHAVRAEYVPMTRDRYSWIDPGTRILCESGVFNLDTKHVGGTVGSRLNYPAVDYPGELKDTYAQSKRLVSLPPFTKVSEKFLRQVGEAICRVAATADKIRDYTFATGKQRDNA